MKKSFTLAVAKRFGEVRKTLLLLSIYALSFGKSYSKIDTVLVQDNVFVPNVLTLCLGDTLRFVYNAGAANTHNVHIISPMDSTSADLATVGNVFEFTPATQGVYSYQCGYHAGMTGVFTVNAAPLVDLGDPAVEYCGASLLLDAGNPGSTYIWKTGAATQTITVSSSGNYWVVAYNSCGNSTDSINVTLFPSPPAVNLGPDVTQCGGLLLNAGVNPASKYKYKWSPGGATTSAITVSSSGTYNVVVTDTNQLYIICKGYDTIKVTITGKNPLFEGMENAFPPAGWKRINPDNATTWKKTIDVAKSGTASMVMENYGYDSIGQRDEIQSPLLCDLSNSPQLTFQVAYQLYTNPTSAIPKSDTLLVQASSDSITWNTVYKKYGSSGANQLTTATPAFSATPFVPKATEWRLETVPLPEASKVFVKFINITDYENNLYIDDINISSGVGIDEINPDDYFSVFPNPNNGMFNVQWLMANPSADGSTIEVYNMYGEKVHSTTMNDARVTVNLSNQPNGIYLMEVKSENARAVSKIIINK